MAEAEVREKLQKLQMECAMVETDNPEVQKIVNEIMTEVQMAMNELDSEDGEHHTLKERIGKAVAKLEADHPTLVNSLNEAARILGNAGV